MNFSLYNKWKPRTLINDRLVSFEIQNDEFHSEFNGYMKFRYELLNCLYFSNFDNIIDYYEWSNVLKSNDHVFELQINSWEFKKLVKSSSFFTLFTKYTLKLYHLIDLANSLKQFVHWCMGCTMKHYRVHELFKLKKCRKSQYITTCNMNEELTRLILCRLKVF